MIVSVFETMQARFSALRAYRRAVAACEALAVRELAFRQDQDVARAETRRRFFNR